jgi:aspartyl-tRNA(Asn)/glutamyl-tRNA(Gln) amidotransferase subunit C
MIASTIMSPVLTIADVERVAALARLDLTADEKTLFARQLDGILEYARQLQAVDTSGVPATAHVNARQQREREDEPCESLSQADAVANAPDANHEAGLFRVPRVIGG